MLNKCIIFDKNQLQMRFSFNKDYFWFALLFILLLPLLSLNVKDSHDWGGDFAQYIHQAKNLVEGISQDETGYVFNEDCFIGPTAYPVGFPILLSPVYFFFGNSIYAFTFFLSVLLVLLGLLLFAFFRNYFSPLAAFSLCLIFLYNPWVLFFKGEVMAEIPFSLVLFLAVYLHLFKPFKNNLFHIILLGLLCGFLISIRSIGFSFVLALVLEAGLVVLRDKNSIAFLRKMLVPALSVLTYFLISKVLFPAQDALLPYPKLLDTSAFTELFLNNISYQLEVLQDFFFTHNLEEWRFTTIITSSFLFVFFLLGLIKQCFEKIDFILLFLFVYLFVIFLFSYSGQAGFRFLFPIAPFILYFSVLGLKDLSLLTNNRKKILVLFALCVFSLQYKNAIMKIIDAKNSLIKGPQEEASIFAFEYIKESLPDNALIVFRKPRVLALYTDRKSFGNSPKASAEGLHQQFKEIAATHILVHQKISDVAIKTYLEKHDTLWAKVWNNEQFDLYKKK